VKETLTSPDINPPICISSPQGKTEVHKRVRVDGKNINK
jgi:hypothetical protein